MSSSHRQSVPCNAAVYRDDRAIGPVRLPATNRLSFVEQFNRLYQPVGIALQPLDAVDREGSEKNAAGSRDS